ncbi:hypothetical protein K458DRAFT_174658 [Lentithecium fluviatile CBS 122367]|uniref:Uncharacterized protein n=1 Tax=Lentithecium fluviatile CBS 122367 TaxID=1168545 RepID=A0A6G1JBY6_9PLEO|nr:hypothetical protein K458DRAFT_174658 [Lentithecium fluviatile CBS 122367]
MCPDYIIRPSANIQMLNPLMAPAPRDIDIQHRVQVPSLQQSRRRPEIAPHRLRLHPRLDQKSHRSAILVARAASPNAPNFASCRRRPARWPAICPARSPTAASCHASLPAPRSPARCNFAPLRHWPPEARSDASGIAVIARKNLLHIGPHHGRQLIAETQVNIWSPPAPSQALGITAGPPLCLFYFLHPHSATHHALHSELTSTLWLIWSPRPAIPALLPVAFFYSTRTISQGVAGSDLQTLPHHF